MLSIQKKKRRETLVSLREFEKVLHVRDSSSLTEVIMHIVAGM